MLVEPTPQIDTDLLPRRQGWCIRLLYATTTQGNLPRLFGIGTSSTVDGLDDRHGAARLGRHRGRRQHAYFADTGDNLHIRADSAADRLAQADGSGAALDLDFWSFTFAEGRLDTEAVMVDVDGAEASDQRHRQPGWRRPAAHGLEDAVTLERVAEFNISESISAADLSAMAE